MDWLRLSCAGSIPVRGTRGTGRGLVLLLVTPYSVVAAAGFLFLFTGGACGLV